MSVGTLVLIVVFLLVIACGIATFVLLGQILTGLHHQILILETKVAMLEGERRYSGS